MTENERDVTPRPDRGKDGPQPRGHRGFCVSPSRRQGEGRPVWCTRPCRRPGTTVAVSSEDGLPTNRLVSTALTLPFRHGPPSRPQLERSSPSLGEAGL